MTLVELHDGDAAQVDKLPRSCARRSGEANKATRNLPVLPLCVGDARRHVRLTFLVASKASASTCAGHRLLAPPSVMD